MNDDNKKKKKALEKSEIAKNKAMNILRFKWWQRI